MPLPTNQRPPEKPTRTEMFIGMAAIAAAVFFFVLLVWVGVEGAMQARESAEIVPGKPATLP